MQGFLYFLFIEWLGAFHQLPNLFWMFLTINSNGSSERGFCFQPCRWFYPTLIEHRVFNLGSDPSWFLVPMRLAEYIYQQIFLQQLFRIPTKVNLFKYARVQYNWRGWWIYMFKSWLSGWMIQMLMLLEFPDVVVPTQTTLSHFFFDHGNIGLPIDLCRLFDLPTLSSSIVIWISVFGAVQG